VLIIFQCFCNSLRMASLYRNMEEFSKSYVCFTTYCMHLLVSIIDYTNIGRNVRYQIALLEYSYCSNIQDNLQSSNTSLITSTNCAIFIHYLLFLLHVSLYHTPSSGRTHMPLTQNRLLLRGHYLWLVQ